MMHAFKYGIIGLALVIWACAGTTPRTDVAGSTDGPEDFSAAVRIRQLLVEGAPQLDHSRLMEIYATMSDAQQPIDQMNDLLAALIDKRGDHQRVDQMILIFAAKAIGESRFFISDVKALFDAILDQQGRLNEWVISFVADAIERYPYQIDQGDMLADRLESALRQVRQSADPSAEMFGYHFLPPPTLAPVRDYLSNIKDQRVRESERNRYYVMIAQNIKEADIAASVSYLLARRKNGIHPQCPQVMQCLLRMQSQLPLK